MLQESDVTAFIIEMDERNHREAGLTQYISIALICKEHCFEINQSNKGFLSMLMARWILYSLLSVSLS